MRERERHERKEKKRKGEEREERREREIEKLIERERIILRTPYCVFER